MLLPCLHNVPGTQRWGCPSMYEKLHRWFSSTFGFPPFFFVVDSDWFLHVTMWFRFSTSTVLEISGMVFYKLLLGLKCSSLNGKATFLCLEGLFGPAESC